MVALVGVAAARARGAISVRRLVRRRVAAATCGVTRDRMQRGQRRRCMTARARRGRRNAVGTVRAVARRAPARDRLVRPLRFDLVARGACRRGLSPVRVMAFLATLVSWGRARLFLRMTGPAGWSVRRRVGDRGSVARGADLVSRIRRGECRLAGVALGAECLRVQRREGVRLVAALARNAAGVRACVDVGDARMAARARGRDEA